MAGFGISDVEPLHFTTTRGSVNVSGWKLTEQTSMEMKLKQLSSNPNSLKERNSNGIINCCLTNLCDKLTKTKCILLLPVYLLSFICYSGRYIHR